jgi:hypothetical protein
MSTKPNPKPAATPERSHYERIPTSAEGEFPFHNSQPVDLNALSFTETSRTPYDGDASRSQGKFRTRDSTKTS